MSEFSAVVAGGASKFAVLALALFLTGCSPEREPASDPEANTEAAPVAAPAAPASVTGAPALAVESEGLRLVDPASGRARPLPFGSPREAVLAALASRGAPETGKMEECGSGSLDYALWPDGLKLHFQDGRLAGWALDERSRGAITTASGIGPGSSRADLEGAHSIEVAQTSLGTEFMAGAISGVLDGPATNARVTAMWAGASCVMR